MSKRLRRILLVLCCILFVGSGAMVAYQLLEYSKGDEAYEEAESLVALPPLPAPTVPSEEETHTSALPAEGSATETPAEEKPVYVDPYAAALRDMDVSALREVNPEVLGWILIPRTKISYPVVQGADNEYYLKRTWKKTSSAVGAIYMDYRCNSDLTDFNTIVYGHRMNNGSMFAGLKYYKKASYLKQHPTVYVTTTQGGYQYQIFSVYEGSPSGSSYLTFFSSAEKKQAFLDDVVGASLYQTGVTPTVHDSILTLSTCTGNGHAKRLIVHALRRGAAPEAVPEESAPEQTVPAQAVPAETVPQETVPEQAVPAETVPQETVPEEIAP